MIVEGVDKSGADQVRTYLAIMHAFVLIDDDKWELRLAELHEPGQSEHAAEAESARERDRERRQGVLTMIWSYKEQHKPFSFASMQALCAMMSASERYAKYLVARRSEWLWWDTWLDTFVRRVTYLHNQDNAALRRRKTAWYEETYIPLLRKYDIECERNPPPSTNALYDSYGVNSHSAALTGYDYRDDHFGHSAYDDGYVGGGHHSVDVGGGVAGARQNSVDGDGDGDGADDIDDDLYDRDVVDDVAGDPEVIEHEGAGVGVAGVDDDMVMQNDEAEDEDVDANAQQNDLAPV